jgi:hypothetical protein
MNTGNKRMPTVYPSYIGVHPRLVLIRQYKSISQNFQETETAWSLLKGGRLLLYQRNLGVVDKRRKTNALDDFCDSFGPVVTRRGK